MRKVVTISFSLPEKLLEKLDNKVAETNISRSSLLTIIISEAIKEKREVKHK